MRTNRAPGGGLRQRLSDAPGPPVQSSCRREGMYADWLIWRARNRASLSGKMAMSRGSLPSQPSKPPSPQSGLRTLPFGSCCRGVLADLTLQPGSKMWCGRHSGVLPAAASPLQSHRRFT